jgi:uncharacterized protein (TIGR02271 family)
MNESKTNRLAGSPGQWTGGFDRSIEYDVVDKRNNKFGTLSCVWVDQEERPVFLGVKTGWIFGKTHVVPVDVAEINPANRRIRVPLEQDMIKAAPAYESDRELGLDAEKKIRDYYHVGRLGEVKQETLKEETLPPRFETTKTETVAPAARLTEATMKPAVEPAKTDADLVRIQLSDEEVKISKHQVDAGGVHLRKVIRTERVMQPVDLMHEEIEIERVPAKDARLLGEAFLEQDVYIALHREEPVVEKASHVREEVRAHKRMDIEHRDLAESVRHEDVEVQRQNEAVPLPAGKKTV